MTSMRSAHTRKFFLAIASLIRHVAPGGFGFRVQRVPIIGKCLGLVAPGGRSLCCMSGSQSEAAGAARRWGQAVHGCCRPLMQAAERRVHCNSTALAAWLHASPGKQLPGWAAASGGAPTLVARARAIRPQDFKKIGLEPRKLTAVTQLPTVLYMLIRLHCGAYLQGLGG